jgi:transposase-like protein
MDFPIVELLDDERSSQWLLRHFHPQGLKCPHCGAGLDQAREFRQTKTSQLMVYRCNQCQGVYNLYSRTVFEGRYFRPAQAVLLLRGVIKGQPSAEIGREIGVSRQTVLELRHEIQSLAHQHQPQSRLPDERTETDEMFQNAGEKR